MDIDKIEKRRAYMREYNRKKRESKLLSLKPIKENDNEDEEEITTIQPTKPTPLIIPTTNEVRKEDSSSPITIILQKEKVKYFIIKPDFTLLLKNHKNHRRLMKELLIKTTFLDWAKKNDIVIEEFNKKAEVYNYYHDKIKFYEDLFIVLEREITLPFMYWVDKFELVMNEYRENQL